MISPYESSSLSYIDDRINARDLKLTGSELKQLRKDLGEALGRELSHAEMAKLCGLPEGSTGTMLRWEVSGPSGPAGELLRILAMASERYPILDNFNVFDRWDVPEQERPARRAEFRESMREEVRRRLGEGAARPLT